MFFILYQGVCQKCTIETTDASSSKQIFCVICWEEREVCLLCFSAKPFDYFVVRFCFQDLSVDPVSCTISYNLVMLFGDHSPQDTCNNLILKLNIVTSNIAPPIGSLISELMN